MLVKFAIELDSIDDSTNRSHINRLLDSWRYCGILVHPNSSNAIREQIGSLHPSVKKIWSEAFRKIKKNQRNTYRTIQSVQQPRVSWDSITSSEKLAEYCDIFEVAILEETRALELGVPEGEGLYCSIESGQVEGIRLVDFDQSKVFSRSEIIAEEPVRRNKVY